MDLTVAREQIVKECGLGSVMLYGENTVHDPKKTVLCPTGFLGLESAMGIPGLPKNRIIEVYGPSSSGKTTLALHFVKCVQDAGGDAVYIDVEHALDPVYAKNGIGVNMDDVLVSQPDYGEQCAQILLSMLRIQKIDSTRPLIIVVDSVDALVPKKEIDCDFDVQSDSDGKKQKGGGLGLRARLMSDICRRVTVHLKDTNTCVVFINQIRHKIGVMFGSPETTSGGNALKFYASQRFDIRNVGQYKEGGQVVGNNFKIKVVKNKLAPPFREYVGLNIHGSGMQHDWDVFNALIEGKLLTKGGSWSSISGVDEKFQGYRGFMKLMNKKTVRKKVLKLLG